MDINPEAAGVVQAPQTEQNLNTNIEQAPAVDMHGFTSEQLADMRRFYDANGGFERIKSKISNPVPQPSQPQEMQQQQQYQQQYQQQNREPEYRAPEGSITQQEFFAQQYFTTLAGEEKYKAFAGDIADGSVLRDMAAFNINPLNRDGSIDAKMVRKFLDYKADMMAAHQTAVAPEASAAPTVDYVQVGENISSIDQARQVLRQDAVLRSSGQGGHPAIEKAQEYLRNMLGNK